MDNVLCCIKPVDGQNIKLLNDKEIEVKKRLFPKRYTSVYSKHKFKLDKVYRTGSTLKLYNDNISSLLNKNFNFFIYGAPNTFKSEIMLGDSDNLGIIDIIASKLNYNIDIEFIQVKKEGYFDILTGKHASKIQNISKKVIKNKFEYIKSISLLKFKKNGSLSFSEDSHYIFNIYNNQLKYSFIELAFDTFGDLKRGTTLDRYFINKSLHSLKKCIIDKSLSLKSNFTDLIKESFEPESKNILLVTINPISLYDHDSIKVLEFAESYYKPKNKYKVLKVKEKYKPLYAKPLNIKPLHAKPLQSKKLLELKKPKNRFFSIKIYFEYMISI